VNAAAVSVVTAGGPEVMVVSGGVVSIVHDRTSGVGSTLPAVLTARARNVCEPSAGVPSETWALHGANGASSRLHWKVAVASGDERSNDAARFVIGSGVETKAVSGAAVSIVQANWAGVWSAFPAASTAATVKVCGPSVRSVYVVGFDRGGAITVATRLPLGLADAGGWRDTRLDLPEASWTDVVTGRPADGFLAGMLADFPVALLVRGQ